MLRYCYVAATSAFVPEAEVTSVIDNIRAQYLSAGLPQAGGDDIEKARASRRLPSTTLFARSFDRTTAPAPPVRLGTELSPEETVKRTAPAVVTIKNGHYDGVVSAVMTVSPQ